MTRIDDYLTDTVRFTPGYSSPRVEMQLSVFRHYRTGLNERSTALYQLHSNDNRSSNTSGSHSETDSWAGAPTSTTCTATSSNTMPPWHTDSTVGLNYTLMCEFVPHCELSFPAERWQDWIDHSRSHFMGSEPPPKAICTFCDGPRAIFENQSNNEKNWWNRMTHIGKHYMRGGERRRPDFFVLDYLREKGLLTEHDYRHAMKFSERPACPDLVPFSYRTKESKQKECRAQQQKHDLEKEDRDRRRKARLAQRS